MIKSIGVTVLFLITALSINGQNDNLTKEKIKRIETNLTPSIIIKGTDYEKTTIEAEMKKEHVPGLSIAFVDDGKIAWTKCYGLADIEKKTPVTPNTLFAAASISKPLTALCVEAFGQVYKAIKR
jgi:CubicO group peptidase (beta-lactamase class C family)